MSASAPADEDLSGLGTLAARGFLLIAWGAVLLYTVAVWPEQARPWYSTLAVGLVLAQAFAVSTPGSRLTGTPAVVACTVPALAATLLLVAAGGAIHGRMWNIQVGVFYVAVVLVRGHPLLAWTGFALHGGVLVAFAAVTGQAAELPALLALPAAAMGLGVSWRFMLLANLRRAELIQQAAAETQALAAANRAAAARALAQLADVRSLTRDTLQDLRHADTLDDALRERSARLEVTVRESLRAPRLAAEPVRGAVRRARDRGLVVRLLDDSQGAPVHPTVLDRITAALDGSARGEVVVRLAPPGRGYAATVLHDDGEVQALRIAPDGS